MGILSRIKKGFQSKANSALDKAIDPEKELDLIIAELDEQRKKAIQELIDYKAMAKKMDQDIAEYEEKSQKWHNKAVIAVKAGNDELAKKCLKEKASCDGQIVAIKRDSDESASYALELNRSRKQAETKLRILKLKKGTMANQLRVAKSGSGNMLGVDDDLFERMDQAEDAIDQDVHDADVASGMMDPEDDFDAQLLASSSSASTEGVGMDAELKALKAKMTQDKKALPKASESKGDESD